MQDFIFYGKLGLNHVLDLSAYDHILFLVALALPFSFSNWKKVVVLTSIFTVAHCISLYLSVYDIVLINPDIIEFLIPLTILVTALFNLKDSKRTSKNQRGILPMLATAFFGLVHGFGFSNYFKMLMAEEENQILPLLSFATGIEVSQVLIVLMVLSINLLFVSVLKIASRLFVLVASILIVLVTIPMLIATFPW